ncbi:hypothetical protein [Variovorax rhizosphaerae]|uniref:Uncharacterized protein n=1 Tax=Variovorax rhizosphaerae TaxID=1836200 RepID=A0ABU8WVV7_9BURK
MNVNPTVSRSGRVSGEAQPASRIVRWCALGCVALALAAGVTAWTGTGSYEENLADIVMARSSSNAPYDASRESPALMRLFADSAGDRELTLKLELALLKHRDSARRVLEAFGAERPFQEVLRGYGEGVVPVVDYFMVNDIATLWAKWKLLMTWETLTKLFGKKASTPEDAQRLVDRPRFRGIAAIETIRVDGYHFLGQFVFDEKNQLQRVQTDRVLESLKKLFTGSVTELESKYRRGEDMLLADFAWAGVDLVPVLGVTRAVAFLGKGAVAGKAVEDAAVVSRRTTLMGHGVLMGEQVGARVAAFDARLASAYLVARHPSLLSGGFGAIGKFLGFVAWQAILLGWWVVSLVVMLLILPALRGLTLLIAPLRWIAGAAAWALPRRRQPALNAKRA